MGKFDPNDKYFKRAKEEGYRARSVFKLEEIQEKFKLIKSGDNVLDLGAAPGSFLQYISKIVGERGSANSATVLPSVVTNSTSKAAPSLYQCATPMDGSIRISS